MSSAVMAILNRVAEGRLAVSDAEQMIRHLAQTSRLFVPAALIRSAELFVPPTVPSSIGGVPSDVLM